MKDTTAVIDCETVAPPWAWSGEDHENDWRPAAAREMAAKRTDRQTGEPMTAPVYLALLPPGAVIASLAVLGHEAGQHRVLVNDGLFERGAMGYDQGESVLLRRAAGVLSKATRFVTWNGRRFDLPLLIHRMVVHHIKPPRNLVIAARESKYRPNVHVDLMDQMTFYGGFALSLRAACLSYRLGDPKAQGDGSDVAELVRAGRRDDLVEYAAGDVVYLDQLYERWRELVGV